MADIKIQMFLVATILIQGMIAGGLCILCIDFRRQMRFMTHQIDRLFNRLEDHENTVGIRLNQLASRTQDIHHMLIIQAQDQDPLEEPRSRNRPPLAYTVNNVAGFGFVYVDGVHQITDVVSPTKLSPKNIRFLEID